MTPNPVRLQSGGRKRSRLVLQLTVTLPDTALSEQLSAEEEKTTTTTTTTTIVIQTQYQ